MTSKMRKNNIIVQSLFWIFFLPVLFVSCKSQKESSQVALQQMNKNERLENVINQALSFETLSSPMKFTLKPGEKSKSISVSGQLKIKKDEAIFLSLKIPILGTEAFRLVITPENVIVIDRINRQYLSESITEIQAKAPFDFNFYSFQALLSNQLFIAGKKELTNKDFSSFQITENEYFVNITNKDNYSIYYDFVTDFTNRILKTSMYKENEQTNLAWTYDQFNLTSNKRLFPTSMKMELTLPKDKIQLDLTFNSVNIDDVFDIDYSIPTKYKQINLQSLIELIKRL